MIKLNESQLNNLVNKIVNESVKKILKEGWRDKPEAFKKRLEELKGSLKAICEEMVEDENFVALKCTHGAHYENDMMQHFNNVITEINKIYNCYYQGSRYNYREEDELRKQQSGFSF